MWGGAASAEKLPVFLGNASWASLPSMNLSSHNSPFISDFSTRSHSLLYSQAEPNSDHEQPPQCHRWSAPTMSLQPFATHT